MYSSVSRTSDRSRSLMIIIAATIVLPVLGAGIYTTLLLLYSYGYMNTAPCYVISAFTALYLWQDWPEFIAGQPTLADQAQASIRVILVGIITCTFMWTVYEFAEPLRSVLWCTYLVMSGILYRFVGGRMGTNRMTERRERCSTETTAN
jgi:hypothetical protein